MHQPLIPAGGDDLRTAPRSSATCKYMMDNPGIGDNHNASVFHWCYKRMGEFIPQLVDEGKQPRVMLDYSGTLLHGLRADGRRTTCSTPCGTITCDPRYRGGGGVAGLPVGPRGGAVHAGAGLPAARPGLAAPLRRDLRPGGAEPRARLLPGGDGAAQPSGRRLRVREDAEGLRLPLGAGPGAHGRAAGRRRAWSASTCRTGWSAATRAGEAASIIAIIKTQGSDTKLVGADAALLRGQGARRAGSWPASSVPPLVTQIADGENGGVMMNEFPPKYLRGHARVLGLARRRP